MKMTAFDLTGVILAGGLNRRFGGKTKANEIIGGETIISRIIKTIQPLFDEIIIVTNTPAEFSGFSEFKMCGDIFSGRGPLGGIHAAMSSSSKKSIFVLAGDMPFTNPDLIRLQVDDFMRNPADASLPEVNGNIEPLHAVYMTHLEPRLGEYLASEEDFTVRRFLKTVKVRYYKPADQTAALRAFTNINTPGEARYVQDELFKQNKDKF